MGSIIGKRRQVTTTQVVITKSNNSPGQASQPRTVGGGGGGGGRGYPYDNGNGGGGGGGGGANRDNMQISGAIGGNEGTGMPQGPVERELPKDYNYAAETQRGNAMKNINLDELARPNEGVQRAEAPKFNNNSSAHHPANQPEAPKPVIPVNIPGTTERLSIE